MLRVGALVATLLLLAPVTGYPILGRQLVLWEVWPGHGVKYQEVCVATAKNGAYKISVNRIFEPSAWRRSSADIKSFKRNLEILSYMNCQQKNTLKCMIFYKGRLYLIANKNISVHNSRRHLNKIISGGQIESRKMWNNILKNAKFQVEMNCHIIFNVRFKSDTKRTEQLQMYIENKYTEIVSSLDYIILQANMMLKVEDRYVLKNQEIFKNIMELKQTILKVKQHIDTGMLQKKKYKQNNEQMLGCDKDREFSRENRNAYDKVRYGMFTDRKKALNSMKKGQYMGFERHGLLSQNFQWGTSFPVRGKTVWKQKTLTKKIINKNCRFPFVYAYTYQRDNGDVLKMFSAHKMVLSNVQGKNLFAFQRKMYRNTKLIGKWNNVQMQPSVIHPVFPTTKTGVFHGGFNSEVSPAKPPVHMTKMLKYLVQSSQRVKKKFNVTQKGHRNKTVTELMVRKHLDTEDSFPTFLYLYKLISNSPLIVERSKRSAKGETVPISVDILKRLTSALIAGTTIFGIALFVLAIAACYLYDKRRQLGQFFDTVLKGEKSGKKSKSVQPQSFTPVSISQNFHFAQPQELRRNRITLASPTAAYSKEESDFITAKRIHRNSDSEGNSAAEAYSKEESDFVTVKHICSSSDSEGSSEKSHEHRSLTVRSRAYVFPSRSCESIQSFCADVCDVSSSQLSLSDESKVEDHFSNPSSTIPKEKELVPLVPQLECSYDNQEQHTSTDLLQQLKKPTDSSQLSFLGEIAIENQFSNLSITIPKDKETEPVIPQPECSCDNQKQCTSSDLLPQLKKATSSSQLSLLGEITIENQFLHLSATTPKEKELVPTVPPSDCLCDNQEQCTSNDLLPQLKKATDSPQLCLLREITAENQLSNLSTATPNEKELVPVVPEPDCLFTNKEQCISSDPVAQIKKATDSSQLSLGIIAVENQFSNLCIITPKEKELFPIVTQPEHSLCHNQEQCRSGDVLQLKRSKSENDIRPSSRMSHTVQSLTHISRCT